MARPAGDNACLTWCTAKKRPRKTARARAKSCNRVQSLHHGHRSEASGCLLPAVDGALSPGSPLFHSMSGVGSLGFCLDVGGDDIRRDFPRDS